MWCSRMNDPDAVLMVGQEKKGQTALLNCVHFAGSKKCATTFWIRVMDSVCFSTHTTAVPDQHGMRSVDRASVVEETSSPHDCPWVG